jgi:hypothetical protein
MRSPLTLLGNERGAALPLAMVISVVVLFITAAVARAAWDASMAGVEGRLRTQVAQAAASGAELKLATLRRTITEQLVPNIRDQGCRRQNENRTRCDAEGNDTGRTSGVRLDRFRDLAAASGRSWPDLQHAFVEVFRQVMPLAPEQDRYRTPATWGYAGLAIRGRLEGSDWFAYGIIAPVPGRSLHYNRDTRAGTVVFELRAYGWGRAPLEGVQGGRLVSAQATAYTALVRIEMSYPHCPDWWVLDSVCMYPHSVSVEIPLAYIVQSDPAVTGRPW